MMDQVSCLTCSVLEYLDPYNIYENYCSGNFKQSLTKHKVWKFLKATLGQFFKELHCVKCPNTEFFLVRIFLYSD